MRDDAQTQAVTAAFGPSGCPRLLVGLAGAAPAELPPGNERLLRDFEIVAAPAEIERVDIDFRNTATKTQVVIDPFVQRRPNHLATIDVDPTGVGLTG